MNQAADTSNAHPPRGSMREGPCWLGTAEAGALLRGIRGDLVARTDCPAKLPSSRTHARCSARLRAFSLLETTIAVGILGVGLVIVAAVFPVALSQHRETSARLQATELLSKAESMLRSRINEDELWIDGGLRPGEDAPWYLVPSSNLYYQALAWDEMAVAVPPTYNPLYATSYANAINGVTETDVVLGRATPLALLGLDALSDRVAPGSAVNPFTDAEFRQASLRFVWYGFYRRLGNGSTGFAVAVCRQQREQLFAEQYLGANDVGWTGLADEAKNPYSTPIRLSGALGEARRLPVPWRVSVGRDAVSSRRLFNGPVIDMLGDGIPLGILAPRGSKIMIQGTTFVTPAASGLPLEPVPVGRVLTIAEVYDATPNIVETVEDVSDLPVYDDGLRRLTFDVWIFPPPVVGTDFDDDSPLIDWTPLL